MRNDRIACFLVHLIDEGIDTGPILFSKNMIFPSSCKIPKDFEDFYKINFFQFYKEFITGLLRSKKYQLKYQNLSLRRYNPRLNTKVNGWIDWKEKSVDIYNFINAFDDPYEGASSYVSKRSGLVVMPSPSENF